MAAFVNDVIIIVAGVVRVEEKVVVAATAGHVLQRVHDVTVHVGAASYTNKTAAHKLLTNLEVVGWLDRERWKNV